MPKFIIHVDLGYDSGETEVPVFAKDLDEAAEWAEKTYEDAGFVVNRIRPLITNHY